MPRARNIKPGFLKNEDLAECEPLARLLFAGLWMWADRSGRMEDRPKRIKADILPYDNCDGESLIAQLAARGFVTRYEVNGARYLQVTNFDKHQNPHHRENKSTIPAPVKPRAFPGPSLEKVGPSPEDVVLDPLIPVLEPPIPPTIPEDADETEEDKPNAPTGACSNTPSPSTGVVSISDGIMARPTVRSIRGKRSAEQLRAALGNRLTWWTNFWEVYPCHAAMNPAMDVFERKVRDVELARLIYQGAKRYRDRIAASMAADPTTKVKYGQGWLNEERWTDETVIVAPAAPKSISREWDPTKDEEAG